MRYKILIIEDNEQNLYLLSFLLEKNGYEVIQSKDGRQGIAMAEEHQPTLILLDIQLPVMNGYEVARALKKIHPWIPFPLLQLPPTPCPETGKKPWKQAALAILKNLSTRKPLLKIFRDTFRIILLVIDCRHEYNPYCR